MKVVGSESQAIQCRYTRTALKLPDFAKANSLATKAASYWIHCSTRKRACGHGKLVSRQRGEGVSGNRGGGGTYKSCECWKECRKCL